MKGEASLGILRPSPHHAFACPTARPQLANRSAKTEHRRAKPELVTADVFQERRPLPWSRRRPACSITTR